MPLPQPAFVCASKTHAPAPSLGKRTPPAAAAPVKLLATAAPPPSLPSRPPLPLQVDMWSAGVVLFILLGGYPPFWSDQEPALFEQIRHGRQAGH
jgi:serine/threonine protein kinase